MRQFLSYLLKNDYRQICIAKKPTPSTLVLYFPGILQSLFFLQLGKYLMMIAVHFGARLSPFPSPPSPAPPAPPAFPKIASPWGNLTSDARSLLLLPVHYLDPKCRVSFQILPAKGEHIPSQGWPPEILTLDGKCNGSTGLEETRPGREPQLCSLLAE